MKSVKLRWTIFLSALSQISACDLYNDPDLTRCRDFILYTQSILSFDRLDLIFDLPPSKKFETERLLLELVQLLIDETSQFKLRCVQFEQDKRPKKYQGVAKVVLEDTMNMTTFLRNTNYTLDTTSQWIILGSSEMPWENSLTLRYNSRIILAKTDQDEVVMSRYFLDNGQSNSVVFDTWMQGSTEFASLFYFDATDDDNQLNVIVYNDPPFIIVNEESDGNLTITGYLMDLWKGYEEFVDIRSTFVISNETHEGFFANGTWTGVIGELISGEKNDVALMVKHEAREVSDVFDSITVINLRLTIYQRKEIKQMWTLLTDVKSNMVPFLIFLLCAFGGIVLTLLGINRNDAFFMIVTIYLQQSCSFIPGKICVRIAVLSLMLMSLYVITVNIGDITSLLIENEGTKVLKIEDLLDPARKVTIVNQSTTHHMLEEANDDKLKYIFRRITNTNGFAQNTSEAIQLVMEEGYVLLGIKEHVDYFLEDSGFEDRILSSITTYDTPAGFLIWKHSTVTDSLYTTYLKMNEMGFMSRLREHWWQEEKPPELSFEQVGWVNSWQLFLNFFTCMFISIMILVIETYYYRSTTPRYRF